MSKKPKAATKPLSVFTGAEAIKRQSRVYITGEAHGNRLLVLRPTVNMLVDAGVNPIVANVGVSDKERARVLNKQFKDLLNDITKMEPLGRKLLVLCALEPRIFAGPPADCPEEMVTVEDLGNDVYSLTEALLVLAGGDGAAEEAATAVANFRKD